MYITVRRNKPCIFCRISSGKEKVCTAVCGHRKRERKVEIPICPACIMGMGNLLDI